LREIIFSHALRAKVKKILPKVYRCLNSGDGIGFVWRPEAASSPQDEFAVTNPILFGRLTKSSYRLRAEVSL
jgi:hypothetical protein